MSWFAQAIITGFTSFVATNIDDIVILMLFFSQVNATLRPRHIVVGQYLGFSALIVASLPGFFGGLIVPKAWIGLLGIVPVAIGITHLANRENDQKQVQVASAELTPLKANLPILSTFLSLIAPQTYQVAAVTIANGGDNIAIYVSLFASSNRANLVVILSVFFLLIAVWCYTAYQLSHHPAVAHLLTRYGDGIVPFVLIGLGIFILIESGTYQLIPLFQSSYSMNCF